MNKEELRIKYDAMVPNFENLSSSLMEQLKKILSNIEYFDISKRIKTFNSFYEKSIRKGYLNPLLDIEDICGLRVICYNEKDIKRIVESLEKEFVIFQEVDKKEEFEFDRFGYRSTHLVVSIRDEWLSIPNFRGLEKLKAEIQIRTVLSHAWANISHKLSYKNEDQVPKCMKRRFAQLSAILELADELFEDMSKDKSEFSELFKENNYPQFNNDVEITSDSLTEFIKMILPDKILNQEHIPDLVDELRKTKITFSDLFEGMKKVKKIEQQYFNRTGRDQETTAVAEIRLILDITNDYYWFNVRDNILRRQTYYGMFIDKLREKLGATKT